MKFLFSVIYIITTVFASGQSRTYSIVFLNKKSDAEILSKEQSAKIMEGHMANIGRLHEDGKLLAAGPFHGGGGIFILSTTSTEEAKQWLSTDPGVQANRWNVEILPYTPRYGSVCSVKEPYEMVNYQFVRYDAVVSKFTAGNYPQIIKKHNEYLRQLTSTGNVLTEEIFCELYGGILVMK
jgi:uncharacterized protein YciI